MNRKIPPDAFDFYFSLGPGRSYQAVADEYSVSKRAITDLAAREGWTKRLEKIEREARDRSDQKLVETLDDVRTRHLKTVRAMHARALAALKQYPLASGMEAMRAAEMVIKLERLIVGEPTDRTATSVEEVIRREFESWMTDDDGESLDGEGDSE